VFFGAAIIEKFWQIQMNSHDTLIKFYSILRMVISRIGDNNRA